MTKKTRLTILLSCVICFFVGAGIIIPYSMGYRFDFEKMKITLTGGIYIRSFPAADQITIDSKIKQKPGMFSNWIFAQSLLPNNHTILVEKEGYYSYSKTLPVLEKEVTKLENIILIKKDLKFEVMSDLTKSPFIKTTEKPTVWLDADGFLYQTSSSSTTPQKLTTNPLKVSKKINYKVSLSGQDILVNYNGVMLIYNKDKKDLENFEPTLAYKKITDCQWINDYNIIFLTDGKVIISEIDTRGSINSVALSEPADQIYFDQSTNKLYVLQGKIVKLTQFSF